MRTKICSVRWTKRHCREIGGPIARLEQPVETPQLEQNTNANNHLIGSISLLSHLFCDHKRDIGWHAGPNISRLIALSPHWY